MPGAYKQLNNRGLLDLSARGAALVDIRREEEWRLTGVIEGSYLLTFFAADGSSDPQAWLHQLSRLCSDEQPLVMICRSGYRTSLICDFLIEINPEREIYNLTEGILSWLAAGLPVIALDDVSETFLSLGRKIS